jgi:hypothetical protein
MISVFGNTVEVYADIFSMSIESDADIGFILTAACLPTRPTNVVQQQKRRPADRRTA